MSRPAPRARPPKAGTTQLPPPADLLGASFRAGAHDYIVLSHSAAAPAHPRDLTPAESDVLTLLLAGRSNAAIARARDTALRTTANQVASIFRKLGVNSRAELASLLITAPAQPRPARSQPTAAQQVLRQTASAAAARAATHPRQSRPEAIALWHDLVQGHWSVVDRYQAADRQLLIARHQDPRLLHTTLTRRERQTVARAALGHSNRQIAQDLGLGESTISEHLSAALSKLGLRSRVELPHLLASNPKARARDGQASVAHLAQLLLRGFRAGFRR